MKYLAKHRFAVMDEVHDPTQIGGRDSGHMETLGALASEYFKINSLNPFTLWFCLIAVCTRRVSDGAVHSAEHHHAWKATDTKQSF